MKDFRPLLLVLLVALIVVTSVSGQQYPPPVPRDGATKVFENDRVAIWDVSYTKGEQPVHQHNQDLVRVTLQAGTRKVIDLDGATRNIEDTFGGVQFIPKGVTHREEGTSDVPTRNILVLLK